jgi:beta-lactamase superfamily II metal-dependent hydrolase
VRKNTITIIGIFLTVVIFIGSQVITLLQSTELQVVFLNVGQGDAIWIQAPNGKEVLIDAGPNQTTLAELSKVKSFFDRTIDFIMITHSDKDHIGGFPEIFERYTITNVIESEISSPTIIDKTVTSSIEQERATKIIARAGERIVLDPKNGVVIDVLFPDQKTQGWETNEASLIVKLSYGSNSFLLTGDAPAEVEDFLVQIYGSQLQSDVLKLGHHGSKTSTSDAFITTVQPDIAIVSAGLGNRYGHPHPEVIERAENANVQVLETAQQGSITCRSNGVRVVCSGE